jgi:hypothetical protein
VWLWNGTGWRSLPGPPIAPREDALLVSDPASSRVWLYGGRRRDQVFSDLWLFDGTSWQLLDADGAPGALEHAAAAWDRERRRLIVFGGAVARATSGRTWVYDGIRWTNFDAAGPAPRVGHGMTWSSAEDAVVLYGGFGAEQFRDLWQWDGSRWHLLASEGPSYTEGHVVTEAKDGIHIVGTGLNQSDTLVRVWHWDGKAFHVMGGTGPSSRVGATATWDARRGALVYWGGSTTSGAVDARPPSEFVASRWSTH